MGLLSRDCPPGPERRSKEAKRSEKISSARDRMENCRPEWTAGRSVILSHSSTLHVPTYISSSYNSLLYTLLSSPLETSVASLHLSGATRSRTRVRVTPRAYSISPTRVPSGITPLPSSLLCGTSVQTTTPILVLGSSHFERILSIFSMFTMSKLVCRYPSAQSPA